MTSLMHTYFTSAHKHLQRLLGPQQRPTLHLDIPDTYNYLERLNQQIADELWHLEEPIHFARRPSPSPDILSQIDGTIFLTPEDNKPAHFTDILPFANEVTPIQDHKLTPINNIGNDENHGSDDTADNLLPFARTGLDSPEWTIESLLAPQDRPYWIPHGSTVPPEPKTVTTNILSNKADQEDITPLTSSPSSSEDTEVFVYTWQQKYINHRVTMKLYIPPHQRLSATPIRPIKEEAMNEDWSPTPQEWKALTKTKTSSFKGQCYQCSKAGHKARYCQETTFMPKRWTFTGHCYYCCKKGHKWRKCVNKGHTYAKERTQYKQRKTKFQGRCHHCHKLGHKKCQCPLCYYCYQKGHQNTTVQPGTLSLPPSKHNCELPCTDIP
jgi:hypothetical protein